MNDEEKEELKIRKAVLFVEHIESHLGSLNKTNVICKICGKTIDEIYNEEK